jgi:aubergine-like protein
MKHLTVVVLEVPSQCIVGRTISKPQMMMSVCTKVAIQLNCKMGGEVWAVDIPMKKGMVVGFDTYHDSVNKGQSVGGFVASVNPSLTRYTSRVTFHHTGQELWDQLGTCMTACLKAYREENGQLPEKIIFYRDGVGVGQLATVKEHEIAQLKACFNSVYAQEKEPQLVFIVVTKRITTRLLKYTHEGRLMNPDAGTVVDTEITKPYSFDFFLVSQSVRQGTVSPTYYNVIEDSSSLKVDHIQRLTYKLTHLYYNWPGTIRVPAPCQYAHKLAFLVGQSIHTAPSRDLCNRLFFL